MMNKKNFADYLLGISFMFVVYACLLVCVL